MKRRLNLVAGEWVEVRSREEILATLDKKAQLEDLPFMPEMFGFCGKRFRVAKRAHKTCDPPNGLLGRRMTNAVHLDSVRCSGDAHGGCQAACLIFWKESWLKRIDDGAAPAIPRQGDPCTGCTASDVVAATCRPADDALPDGPSYVCQSTQVHAATAPLHWWDLRQYVEDYTSGNVQVSQMIASMISSLYHEVATAGLGFGTPMRWLYDVVQEVRGGAPYPWRRGTVPQGTRTPSASLNLQVGELVRVRRYDEILATLDQGGHNRGMWFDAELVPYCGGTYRVQDRVNRIINEKTGKMQHLKNDCIVLQDVVCRACYARYRKFCPRGIVAYWREVWLERVQ